jgi:beta-lactamase class A
MIDRRSLVAALLALPGCMRVAGGPTASAEPFERIRAGLGKGARFGFAALDTGSGRRIGFDTASRYAMCSTFKLPLAAAVLSEVDRGKLTLADEVGFTAADLQEYAPVVRANLARGRLSLEALCASIIEVSDNSAANLLLSGVGGPPGLTRFMRRCGDSVSRLDRDEPTLNQNLPGDPRDTTNPEAMVGLMRVLLTGNILSADSRDRLIAWMEGATTGLSRLRAGLPSGWRVGDKTGTGANGAHNDVAIAWPPSRSPILMASFQSGGDASGDARNAAHAAAARLVAQAFA